MKKVKLRILRMAPGLLATVLLLGGNLVPTSSLLTLPIGPEPAVSAESSDQISPEADKLLKSMSAYLAKTQSFSVEADIDFEVVMRTGQKLQLSSFATAVVQRPGKFRIQRQGPLARADFIFDGNTLTVYGRKSNVYVQKPVAGTIDDAIRAFELETGIPTPGGDFMFADPYAILSNGVESSRYLGTAYINGVECHHFAFREDEFDWQIWIQTGNTPLPMKYVITSKWQMAAPQYEIRFRNWNTSPQIAANLFNFTVPSGAQKLENFPASDLDESTLFDEE